MFFSLCAKGKTPRRRDFFNQKAMECFACSQRDRGEKNPVSNLKFHMWNGESSEKRSWNSSRWDPKTLVDTGTQWAFHPPPPVSIPTMSKPGSRSGNNSKIHKGAISLTSHPDFCIAQAGKRPYLPFPRLPGSNSPIDLQFLGRFAMANPAFSCRRTLVQRQLPKWLN